MFGIKKQFIKNMIKLEVVSNIPGKLEIYVSQIKKIEDTYKVYEIYANKAMMLLEGVKKVDVNYDKGLLIINYDDSKLNPREVYGWLETIVNIGIEYYDDIKQSWDKNGEESEQVKKIWNNMEPILVSKLK